MVLQQFRLFQTSSTSAAFSALPITFILFVTMVKDGIEDLKRHRSDNEINLSAVRVLQGVQPETENKRRRESDKQGIEMQEGAGSAPPVQWLDKSWQDLRVGDIIQLSADAAVPGNPCSLF